MNTDNIVISDKHVKRHGPFKSRSDALISAKSNTDCRVTGFFTLIRSRQTKAYDYVPGCRTVLMSDDQVMAEYILGFGGVWVVKS